MTQNPFDEPGDQDRTIIRPAPGGSRAPARATTAPPPVPPVPAAPEVEPVATGGTPLAIAAAPLLQLLGRLRNTATAPDPGDMRERTRRELRAFEKRARDAGVPMDRLRLAHYALCASLDDVVLNTPWGNHGRWHDEPLAVSLHKDDQAGTGFFDQLRTLRTTLPTGMDVVEVMFICLSLGMMGPYRTAPEGAQQLERVRHQVFGLIEPAAAPGALSIDTAPLEIPRPARTGLPMWVVASAALGLIAALYVFCLTNLNATSDSFYQDALAAPPTAMPALVRPAATPPPPPPPAPPEPDAAARLQAELANVPGIEVVDTPAATILRLPAAKLFTASNATLAPGPMLERIGKAVGAEPGRIRVVGYTDSQPPRTVAFPSKFALSNAQAAAVRTALARHVPEPHRITAEGRADADPLAPNTTAEGRERNRRVEIVLPRSP